MQFKFGAQTNIQRILILVAMDVEKQAAQLALHGIKIVTSLTLSPFLKIESFKSDTKELLLAECGIGLANAAMALSLVAQSHSLDGVILLGVAGSLRSELAIGSLVLGNQIIQHDSFFSGESGRELMAPGEPFVSIPASQRRNPVFKTDSTFNVWLTQLKDHQIHTGTLLSGSEFVGSAKRKIELAHTHPDAFAVEMEAAGVALAANKYQIPFAVIKTIADRLNPDHSVSHDYNAFISSAAKNAATVLGSIRKHWLDK